MSTSCGYHRFHFRWEIPYWVSQWSRTIIRILCALKHWIQTTDCEDEVKPAMSAEPGWWKPYADDLQWRIVYQHLAQGLSYQAIARNLSIATSTVQWLYALFETTDVQPLDPWKGNKTQTGKKKKLYDHTELYITGMVMENSSLCLGEVCQQLQEALGISISPPTVCRLLKAYGITRKKIRQIATQRCDRLHGAFLAHCSL